VRKRIICFICVIAALCFAACNGGGDGVRGIRPPNISVEEFYRIPSYEKSEEPLIGLWNVNESDFPMNQSRVDEIAAAGFDLVLTGYPDGGQARMDLLERIGQAGMKAIVNDEKLTVPFIQGAGPFVRPFDASSVEQIAGHPALYGVLIRDEPLKPEIEQYMVQRKKDFDNAALRGDPKFFVNLSSLAKTYGYDSHEQQVDYFVEKINPPMVCYDLYGLTERNGKNVWDEEFLSVIERASYTAKIKHGLPVWMIKLTSGHAFDGVPWEYPSPSEAELRWQTAAAMAFGTDFIMDYTYSQEDPTYVSLVDKNGDRTEMFDKVKAVNLEAGAWKDVYHAFSPGWIGTAGLGGSHGKVNGMFRRLAHEIGVADMDAVKSVVTDEDVLMGYFKDGRRNNGFMLTNGSAPTGATITVSASVTVELETRFSGVQVFEKGVPKIYDLGKDGKLTITLEPGEGKFLIPLVKK